MASPPPKIRWAIFVVLALIALAVRLPELGERPMHTDESINAYIIGQLLAGQPFRYDPQDRHGPALAAVTLPMVKLEGAGDFASLTESELRLSPVLAGVATILLLGAGVEMFGFVACLIAALLLIGAPLPLYYHRYFIHESLFVLATLGLILSGWRALKNKSLLHSGVAGFCAAIMLAAKETAPLHFVALAVAILICCLNRFRPSQWTIALRPFRKGVFVAGVVFVCVTLLLFTWFGRNWGVFAALFHAVHNFAERAGGEGHQKPFWYYAKLLCDRWSGKATLALAVLGIGLVLFTRRGRRHQESIATSETVQWPSCRLFLVVYGLVIFAIYSLIPYKTPWLALNFWLVIPLFAGMAVEWFWFANAKLPVRALIVCLLFGLGILIARDAHRRVFVDPADENNPYAYAHTVDDLLGLPDKIEEVSQQRNLKDPRIAVVAADAWPLPWYLRHYSQVGYWQPGQATGPANFYITTPEAADAMTNQLANFRPEYFGIRPEVLIVLWIPNQTPAPHPQ